MHGSAACGLATKTSLPRSSYPTPRPAAFGATNVCVVGLASTFRCPTFRRFFTPGDMDLRMAGVRDDNPRAVLARCVCARRGFVSLVFRSNFSPPSQAVQYPATAVPSWVCRERAFGKFILIVPIVNAKTKRRDFQRTHALLAVTVGMFPPRDRPSFRSYAFWTRIGTLSGEIRSFFTSLFCPSQLAFTPP